MVYQNKERKPLFVEYCPDTAEDGNRLEGMKVHDRLTGATDVCRQLKIRARIVDINGNYEGHIMEDGRIDWNYKHNY